MRLITSIVLTASLFFLFSCNPKVEIPAYIYVEKIDFTATDFEKEGTSSYKIASIEVTVNGKNIGTYALPALLPVIASGNTDISIAAGIKLNGLALQRPVYPLYTTHKETINLTKGKIDTISPLFHYDKSITFDIIEDFESAGLKFSPVEGSATLNKTQDNSLLFHYPNEKNEFSGIIQLPYEDTVYHFEIKTTAPIYLTANSVKVACFVELNYCFSENVEIGIYAHSSSSSSLISRQYSICYIMGTSNLEWGKIYVNLTDIINSATVDMTMTHFDIYMKCGVSKNKTGRFLFDNIKVIHQ
ncbi:MAG: hypothetical protein LBE13_11580 [Bacteroidales bacterium]|jgi:hypothetical protein|nr:hypothetical protein [Bacteroidales bacterium]